MKIVVGHTNMDLDCIGSMVLAGRLFPDHRPVRSRLIHPAARNLYNLYQGHLGFLEPTELEGASVDHVVVVDTRSWSRVSEFLSVLASTCVAIDVFDHHPADSADIPGAVIHERPCGANTTLLGLELMERGMNVSPEEATVALVGIYADTGRFTHTDVTPEDFDVASFLLASGASLEAADRLLRALRDEQQVDVFHRMAGTLVHREINGHEVQLCTIELDEQVPGLAAVVEKLFEIEEPDALFAVFGFRKGRQALIVARSRRQGVEANRLLEPFGGAGHAQAAAAHVKGIDGATVMATLIGYLERALEPAATAGDIMTSPAHTIRRDWDVLAASLFLERINHSGAPVVDAEGRLVGFLTLRDIMKARKVGAMDSPVAAFMAHPVHCCEPKTGLWEVEQLMYRWRVGRLPVVCDGRVEGIVTRGDLVRYFETGRMRRREALAALGAAWELPLP